MTRCDAIHMHRIIYKTNQSLVDCRISNYETHVIINLKTISTIISAICCITIGIRVITVTIANPIWIMCCAVRILCIELEAISTIISASCRIFWIIVITYTIANNIWILCFTVRISCIQLEAISTIKPASFCIIIGTRVITETIANPICFLCVAGRISCIELEAISKIVSASFRIIRILFIIASSRSRISSAYLGRNELNEIIIAE